MNRLLDKVPSETHKELRRLGRAADDVDWPYEVARTKGWRAANKEYHLAQRDFGRVTSKAAEVWGGLWD